MHIIRFDRSAWQGRLDQDFTDGNIARVADALGLVWADGHPGATVLVGFGVRRRAEEQAVLVGEILAAYGLRVVVSQAPIPTSVLAWTAAHEPSCIGAVMLAASAFGPEWGGILLRGSDGGPVSSGVLDTVAQAISGSSSADRGVITRSDMGKAYVESLLSRVDAASIKDLGPRIVVDSLHGATGAVISTLLKRAGAEVIALHAEPEEGFAGLRPDPTEPWVDECEQLVRRSGALCGVAFDEEGGRVSFIDEKGGLVVAHDLMGMLLKHVARRAGEGEGNRVVISWAGSARVRRQAELLGYECTVVPVGFDRMYDELDEGDVLLAIDERGGFCQPAHLRERDGLLACMLGVEMQVEEGRGLTSLVAELRREVGHMDYGQRDIDLDAGHIQRLRNVLPGLNPTRLAGKRPMAVNHADGLFLRFDDDSWVLLRPSRTQPAVRVYAEAPSFAQRDQLLEAASELVHGKLLQGGA